MAFDPALYGDRLADDYDRLHAFLNSSTPTAVETLVELPSAGPVLELGSGTGRITIPLAERGVPVEAIEASAAMVAQMRAKPGGERIPVRIGDFAEVDGGPYAVVFAAANTFFALPSQEDQVRCFCTVAEHLLDDGLMVLEVFVPDPAGLDQLHVQNVRALQIDADVVLLSTSHHDKLAQRLTVQLIEMTESGLRLFPGQGRYAWPAELDFMAKLAGMRLKNRWANWGQEAFTAASPQHVSVYTRA